MAILSSNSAHRRLSSSTSGWSAEEASTRAMIRRCSVIRIPLATHWASMPLCFSTVTGFSVDATSYERGQNPSIATSDQIAAQHQRRGGAGAALVVSLAPADLVEPGPGIEMTGRGVALVDLEQKPPHTIGREPAHMHVEQAPGGATPTRRCNDSNRQNLGFIGGAAGYDEADEPAPGHGSMRCDAAVGQQSLELLGAPAAAKRLSVQDRELRRIGGPSERERRLGRSKQ